MRAGLVAFAATIAGLLAPVARADMSVAVTGASRPTVCAEEDNITVRLAGDGVGALSITALHPAYAAAVIEDSTAPDFAGCDFSADPAYAFTPRTVVLHDGAHWRLVGHTFASLWRPAAPPVSVADGGDRAGGEETDLHLLQLFSKAVSPPIEVLVLYPADGYWRLKPLPPPHLAASAYGSSFLIGPIEIDGRPLVRLAAIRFEPAADRFHLTFARGGEASLRVTSLSPERADVAVAFSPPSRAEPAFAALRSMFVSPAVADVAEVRWQRGAGEAWQSEPILGFGEVTAVAVRFARAVPSRHNTSAPDLQFDRFRPAPQ
ncbi:MAG: hypothetical protein MUE49_13030 [Rhodospirillales bacterium]|nr:hypothetical protein [Rhodospirillales bacterium]